MDVVFQWMTRNAIEVTLLISLLFLVRIFIGRWLSPRLLAAMWLLVLLKLLLPVLPQSEFSLLNLTSTAYNGDALVKSLDPVTSLLFYLWLTGVTIIGLWKITGYTYHRKQLQQSEVETTPELRNSFRQLVRDFGLQGRLHVRLTGQCQSPFLFGLFRPIIYLPLSAKDWTSDETRAVLSHELAHYKRRDHFWDAVSHIAFTLYWFHPLVHLSLSLYRKDRELATDALALSVANSAQYHSYGLTLLRFSSKSNRRESPTAIAFSQSRYGSLRERITRISTFHFGQYDYSIPALIVFGLLAWGFLTVPPVPKTEANREVTPAALKAPQSLSSAPLIEKPRSGVFISTSVITLDEE